MPASTASTKFQRLNRSFALFILSKCLEHLLWKVGVPEIRPSRFSPGCDNMQDGVCQCLKRWRHRAHKLLSLKVGERSYG